MRIETIRIAGFRGFRRPVELRVPSGFLIVTGRNGSGKSTVCDAIEFALTGLIARYGKATETSESIADYLWWRGDEPSEAGYVEIELRDEATNALTTIRRDRTGRFDSSCLSGLCSDGESPADSIPQLCLTSIIRDDTIGGLSFELSETERAGFVEYAVGSGDLQRYQTLLEACVNKLAKRFDATQKEFAAASGEVVRLREELAAAQARLSPSTEVIRAEQRLRQLVGSDETPVLELLLSAEREQLSLRQREQALLELLRRFDSLAALVASETEYRAAAADAKQRLLSSDHQLEVAEREGNELEQERTSKVAPLASALARLHSAGSDLGLDDGRCPLCHSKVGFDEFAKRLDELQRAVAKHSGNLSTLESRHSAALADVDRVKRERTEAERQIAMVEGELARLASEAHDAEEAAARAGFGSANNLKREEIEQQVTWVRTRISELHMTAAILEAQASLERISELMNTVASAQRVSDQTFAALQEITGAKNRATETLHAVQTLAGTIARERLGSISPLLSDLYLRMRPHPDWREVQYRLRGEVRRFLSLLVGPELNPRFVFSSGQRRAAGLAFLLAVHLSRSRCRLDSLILDDPVQHIDDFRALQLIEVLSGIRQSDGRQIICTVEDAELAIVMARRLRPSFSHPGMILRLQSNANGESVLMYEDVSPASGSVTERTRSQAS